MIETWVLVVWLFSAGQPQVTKLIPAPTLDTCRTIAQTELMDAASRHEPRIVGCARVVAGDTGEPPPSRALRRMPPPTPTP